MSVALSVFFFPPRPLDDHSQLSPDPFFLFPSSSALLLFIPPSQNGFLASSRPAIVPCTKNRQRHRSDSIAEIPDILKDEDYRNHNTASVDFGRTPEPTIIMARI